MINSWQDMLAIDDTEYKTVTVGNAVIRLGSVSADDMLEWWENQKDAEKAKTNGLWLFARSLVNEKGERIGNLEEALKLREKNPKTVRVLTRAAAELNGLLEKPGPNASSEASTSASPTALPSPPDA